MSDFQGNKRIKIQPNTENYPLRLEFPVATSVTGGGAIPYGNSIASAQVKVYDPLGVDVSGSMVSNVLVTSPNIVKVNLSYFEGAVEGKYKMTVILTYTLGGYSDEFDADRRITVTDT